MTVGSEGVATILPRSSGWPKYWEPLIEEARERQRRRRFGLAIAVIVIGSTTGFGVDHYVAAGDVNITEASVLPNPCMLLRNAEIAPDLGAPVQARSAFKTTLGRVCTWKSRPMGFEQTQGTLGLAVVRMTRTRFLKLSRQNLSFLPVPVRGIGQLAVRWPKGALWVWQDGIVLELRGDYLAAYPSAAVRLARLALQRMR